MTWCPSTLRAKAERQAETEAAAAEAVVDLGAASSLTRGSGQLPPAVHAWPLRVYLDFTEQPANASPDPQDPQAPVAPSCGAEAEPDTTSRHRGLRAAAHLLRD